MSKKVIYTGLFLTDPGRLLEQIPPLVTGEGSKIHAHHVTKEFRPKTGISDIEIGKRRTLHAIGQVVARGVHAVLVVSPEGETISTKAHPHVTIATSEGVRPGSIDEIIAEAHQTGVVTPIVPPIAFEVIEGYFDDQQVVHIV